MVVLVVWLCVKDSAIHVVSIVYKQLCWYNAIYSGSSIIRSKTITITDDYYNVLSRLVYILKSVNMTYGEIIEQFTFVVIVNV